MFRLPIGLWMISRWHGFLTSMLVASSATARLRTVHLDQRWLATQKALWRDHLLTLFRGHPLLLSLAGLLLEICRGAAASPSLAVTVMYLKVISSQGKQLAFYNRSLNEQVSGWLREIDLFRLNAVIFCQAPDVKVGLVDSNHVQEYSTGPAAPAVALSSALLKPVSPMLRSSLAASTA